MNLQFIKKHKGLLASLGVSLIFLLAAAWQLYFEEEYTLALIPLGLLFLWFLIQRFDTMLLCMALCTPFSINMDVTHELTLTVPTEPLMILFTALFFFRVLVARNYDRNIIKHPVSVLIIVSIAWMLITSLFSQIPLASLKHTVARIWFVVPFYFACVPFFKDRRMIRKFIYCYAVGLAVVVVIATLKTIGNYSDLQTVHRVMQPFYNDHTAYGCVLALFLPIVLYFLFSSESRRFRRILPTLFFLLFCIGIVFSYCRAAWLSLAGALGMYILIRSGMKMKWMLVLIGVGVVAFFSYQGDLLYRMGKNKQDSSFTISEQIQSISNISTDASNLERLNRWASAIRMWDEHKLLGCGPGTYQFLYASYQRSWQLSTISTNAGNLGNAHSEYIGPLTEQGIPGAVIVITLFLTIFATGVRVYRTAEDPHVARLALALTLSLLTYFIHGIFNNFLDTDKLSVPFWAFSAAIIALDIYSEKKDAEPTPETTPSKPDGTPSGS